MAHVHHEHVDLVEPPILQARRSGSSDSRGENESTREIGLSRSSFTGAMVRGSQRQVSIAAGSAYRI